MLPFGRALSAPVSAAGLREFDAALETFDFWQHNTAWDSNRRARLPAAADRMHVDHAPLPQ